MAARLCVGDKGCSFNKVIQAMSNASTFSEIMTKWKCIAVALDCEPEVVKVIGRNMLLHDWTSTDIMIAILPSWRSKSAENATLEKLLKALETNGMNDICTEIQAAFGITNVR